MSLKDEIEAKRKEIAALEQSIGDRKRELTALENSRVKCAHTFSAAVRGYEHEGGHCTKCGINQLHADTLAWQYRTGRPLTA